LLKTVLSLARSPGGHFYCSRGGHANARRADGLGLIFMLVMNILKTSGSEKSLVSLISIKIKVVPFEKVY
jgi:hypothetical protein